MERPLKRQLDKHARDMSLYLRVMYYVSGVSLLTDEMTRYHYFLQLKNDVIEGRICCDVDQAVLLASYSMQAEFGNHDPERHTAEYLKDFALFPKHFTDTIQLESMTEAVICHHASLVGLAQGTAEEYYILATQQLDGYGQETFLAKDENGSEVIIGITLTGIAVGYENTQTSSFYRWKEITNVVNHKRYFGIECQVSDDTVQFQFRDVESAKYVWRMCVYQHTFFMQNEQATDLGNTAQIVRSLFTQAVPPQSAIFSGSGEELEREHGGRNDRRVKRAQSTSCLDLASPSDVNKLRALLPTYRPAPDYETAVQQKYQNQMNNSVSAMYSSQPEIHTAQLHEGLQFKNIVRPFGHFPDVTNVYSDDSQQPLIKTVNHPLSSLHPYRGRGTLDENGLVSGVELLQLYKPPPPYPTTQTRPSSNSTPDLASQTLGQHSVINAQVSGSSPDLVSSRNLHQHYAGALLPNPEAHRTYTNLAAVLGSHQRLEELQRRMGNRSIAYYLQHSATPVLHQTVPYTSVTNLKFFPNNKGLAQVSEPIYENVPLPWVMPGKRETNSPDQRLRSSEPNLPISPEPRIHTSASKARKAVLETNNNISSSQHVAHVATVPSVEPMIPHSTAVNSHVASTVLSSVNQSSNSLNQFLQSEDRNELAPEQYSHNLSTDLSFLSGSGSMEERTEKGRKMWSGLVGSKKSEPPSLLNKKATGNKNVASDLRWSMDLRWLPASFGIYPATSKEPMCRALEKALGDDNQLFFEFEKIPKVKYDADFTTALLSENVHRNRYPDILPYDENRIRLSPSKENKLGYVNASHITASVGNQQRFYIAAQSPLLTTVSNFWQMVWEMDVYLIIQLNSSANENTVKYYPLVPEKPLLAGDFEIQKQFSQESGHCITTRLRVHEAGASRRARGVWHLEYTDWADQGCPNNVAHFLGFLEELSSVREHTITELPAGLNCNPPVLVHCNNGVGRTGVTILCDLLLYTLDHNQEIDIARTIFILRHQRMLMVQTAAQYRFVHSLLLFYSKNSRLI
nr:PREDICTED: tyrosine-protein phosphatase non-receptor type 21 isoform X2 [Bemisia tabaci]